MAIDWSDWSAGTINATGTWGYRAVCFKSFPAMFFVLFGSFSVLFGPFLSFSVPFQSFSVLFGPFWSFSVNSAIGILVSPLKSARSDTMDWFSFVYALMLIRVRVRAQVIVWVRVTLAQTLFLTLTLIIIQPKTNSYPNSTLKIAICIGL